MRTRANELKTTIAINCTILALAATFFLLSGYITLIPIILFIALSIVTMVHMGQLIHEKMKTSASPGHGFDHLINAPSPKEAKEIHETLRVHLDDKSSSLVMGYLSMAEDLEEDNGPPPAVIQQAHDILQENLKDDKANLVSIVMDYFYDAGIHPDTGKTLAQTSYKKQQEAQATQQEYLKRQNATRDLNSEESVDSQNNFKKISIK